MNPTHAAHIREITQAALERVDPYEMITSAMSIEGDTLTIATDESHDVVDLSAFSQVFVIGAGKAGAPMTRAAEEILGDRISGGVVSVKHGHGGPTTRVRLIESGHPIPDENSVRAGREILDLAAKADSRTLVIVLVSGGGSALLAAPMATTIGGAEVNLSLADMQQTTQTLLESGAEIHEINSMRKHLSRIKGGRLAEALAPARTISLILSDVVGDDLDAIASGLTVADRSSYEDVAGIVLKYGIREKLPRAVTAILDAGARGDVPESPKPGSDVFRLVNNVLVGTNYQALVAAERAASKLGYETVVLTSRLTGEARDAATFLASIVAEAELHERPAAKPCCILAGGETTVTIRGEGKGGRNQELTLAMLSHMAHAPELFADVGFASVATDGTDGPTDAAGGFASVGIARRAIDTGRSIDTYLANNDSFHFFDALGELYRTGPTHTNVCDLQIALVGSPE